MEKPGYGRRPARNASAISVGSAAPAQSRGAGRSRSFSNEPSSASRFVERTITDRTDTYWNEQLNLMNAFQDYMTPSWRHENEVDAFRHAYTSGVLSNVIGPKGIELLNALEGQSMDRANNTSGAQLHADLKNVLGRNPTETEYALEVFRAIERGDLAVNQPGQGESGWLKTTIKELERRVAEERRYVETRDYVDRTPRFKASEGMALPPSDRNWERAHDRMRDGGGYEKAGHGDMMDGWGGSPGTMIA